MVVILISLNINAQQKPLTIEETINLAIENNAHLKATSFKTDQTNALIGSAFSFDKTSVYYHYDENNLAINGLPLKVFGVSQDFKFPTVYFADKKVNKAKYNLQKSEYAIKLETLKRDVTLAYYNVIYSKNKANTYKYLDSLYQNFATAAERRFQLGETNYLEMISAKSKRKQIETTFKQAQQDVTLAEEQLKKLVQTETISTTNDPLKKLELQTLSLQNNIGIVYYEQNEAIYKALHQQEKQNLLPDLSLEYFQGTNTTLNGTIKGYQLGVKIPIFFSGNTSRIKASNIAKEVIQAEKQDYKVKLNSEHQMLLAKLKQYDEAINYYETQGKSLSKEIIKTAARTFKEGEIDFFQYIQSIETASDIELYYLSNIHAYNQTIIAINYLIL